MTKMECIQAALEAGARGLEVIALASKIEEYCEGKITAVLGKDGCVEIRGASDGKFINDAMIEAGADALSRGLGRWGTGDTDRKGIAASIYKAMRSAAEKVD